MMEQWVVLSSRMKTAAAYYAARLEPEHLKGADDAGRAVIRKWPTSLFDAPEIYAFAALWPTWDPEWLEFGSAFVHGENGGKGVMKEIMAELIGRASGKNLFFISKDPAIMHLGMQYGFIRMTTSVHPNILRWAAYAGLTCRIPGTVHELGWPAPKPGERWLYMRRAKK